MQNMTDTSNKAKAYVKAIKVNIIKNSHPDKCFAQNTKNMK